MKVTVTEQSASERTIEVVVDAKKVESAFEKAFKKNLKQFALPGFRKGKVPKAMAERYIHNNKVTAILEVGAAMLRGELAYRDGDYEAAWAGLREVHLRPRAL